MNINASIAKYLVPAAIVAGAVFTGNAAADDYAAITADQIMFGPSDPANPDTGEVAVLAGDPSKAEPFVLRLRFKKGTMIQSHSHSTPEYVTVLSGEGRMAFGKSPAEASAKPVDVGSFIYLPAGQYHTVWIDEDTVADLFSVGPFDEVHENAH